MNDKPLSGIKILDLTRLLPGPLCTLHLADLGAEVIKIEDAQAGDYARHAPPLKKNLSTFFLSINRNKRSLVLDITKEEGKKIFRRLSEKADVLVESFRPGVMKKFSLGYEEIKKVNPGIIYCSITGYGNSGPNKDKAGHDLNFIAEAGILHRTNNDKPQLPSFQTGDIVGGTLSAAMSILAALIQRQKTGKGQFLDVSIFDSIMAHSVVALSHLQSIEKLGFDSSGMLTGDMHSYNVYETKDNRFLALAAIEFKFWQRFCITLNKPEWLSRHIAFGEESRIMYKEIAEQLKSKTLSEWIEKFKDVDCCLSPVNSLSDALKSEQALARNILIEKDHPSEGKVVQFSFPVKFSKMDFSVDLPAPLYGEHSVQILKEHGFREEEITNLKKKKIII